MNEQPQQTALELVNDFRSEYGLGPVDAGIDLIDALYDCAAVDTDEALQQAGNDFAQIVKDVVRAAEMTVNQGMEQHNIGFRVKLSMRQRGTNEPLGKVLDQPGVTQQPNVTFVAVFTPTDEEQEIKGLLAQAKALQIDDVDDLEDDDDDYEPEGVRVLKDIHFIPTADGREAIVKEYVTIDADAMPASSGATCGCDGGSCGVDVPLPNGEGVFQIDPSDLLMLLAARSQGLI